jgi:hypothetical protein
MRCRSLGLLCALSLVPQLASAQAMTPKDIQETWVGKTLNGTTGNNRSFTMILGADGLLTISGEAANDTGTWRLSDSGYCTTWKTIRAGQERCFTVLRLMSGEMRVINPDGSVSGHINRIQ